MYQEWKYGVLASFAQLFSIWISKIQVEGQGHTQTIFVWSTNEAYIWQAKNSYRRQCNLLDYFQSDFKINIHDNMDIGYLQTYS